MDVSEFEDSSQISLLIIEKKCVSSMADDSKSEDGSLHTSLNQKEFRVKGIFKGNYDAIENIVKNSSKKLDDEEDWQKLINLRNDHVILYYNSILNDPSKNLEMVRVESLRDYCEKKTDPELICKMMWQITRGLEYLHENNIVHGDLELDKVLLWKKNDNNTIVKIALGIIPPIPSNNKPCIDDDLVALGNIFYSITTGDTEKPKQGNVLFLSHLKNLSANLSQKRVALILIKSLLKLNPSFQPSSVKQLLRHPFFTQNVQEARLLLLDDEIGDVEKLKKWYESQKQCQEDEFNDLKQIVSSAKSIQETVINSFESYSEYFSEYVWYITTHPPPEFQKLTFIKGKFIASGGYGSVYGGTWIDEDGNQMKAACKTLKKENQEEFDREVKMLKQLDHLFVVKFLGMSQVDTEKCIVMELCEGTLKQYILGALREEIVENTSLNDKILLGQVTLGLAYIHSKGMIHKNLTPANILLQKSPTSTLVLAKIADFGFAQQLKPMQEEFSKTEKLGTEHCMAPELLIAIGGNKKVQASFQSDAFSLGIIIGLTVLKGRHPYGNKLVQPILMSIGCDPILLQELEWDVTDLILRLTKKEPRERPMVSHVIYHPYFALHDEITKTHFHDTVSHFFENFGNENIMIQQNDNDAVQDVSAKIEGSNENYIKIAKAITVHNEDVTDRCIENPIDFFADYLIETAPDLFVYYVWHLITQTTDSTQVNKKKMTETLKMMDECTFGFLFLKKIEEKEEILNAKIKNSGTISTDKKLSYLLSDLPSYATPRIIIENICQELSDVDYVKHSNALSWALRYRWWMDTSVIETLLKNGANPNLGQPIHLLVQNRNEGVKKILPIMIQYGGNLHSVDKTGRTPLHWACLNNSRAAPDIVKIILDNGGNVDSVNENNRTPVHFAAGNESDAAVEILKILKDNGGNLNYVDKFGQTPLHRACLNKSSAAPEIVKFILDNGGNVDCVEEYYGKPVHFAACNESAASVKILKILMDKGGNLNYVDKFGQTPLHRACLNKSSASPEIVKFILDNGGNFNSVNENNRTPVHFAACNESDAAVEILKILLDKGGNLNSVDKFGQTSLHRACLNKSSAAPEIVKFILDYGRNVDCVDENIGKPVHFAACNESDAAVEILKILMDKGGNLNSVDKFGQTPLHFACLNKSSAAPDIVKFILDNGGNVDCDEEYYGKPVHFAACNESDASVEILNILLDKGGNLNSVDKFGQTPLHFACLNKSSASPDIVKFILDNGGNVDSVNENNRTPVHFAVGNESDATVEILKILLDKRGNLNSVDKFGQTPLHRACLNKSSASPEIVKFILDNGGNVDSVNENNRTPVHFAAGNESDAAVEILKILLDKGGNLNSVDKFGQTPLHRACLNKSSASPEIVKFILDYGGNVDCFDENIRKPVHFAACNESDAAVEILKVLLNKGGNLNSVDKTGRTPLHCACFNTSRVAPDIVKFILDNEENLYCVDEDNETPFHFAASNKSEAAVDILKILLEKGGNLSFFDKTGRTPLHIACLNKSNAAPEIVKFILDNGGNVDCIDENNQTPVDFAAGNESNSAVEILKILLDRGGNLNSVDKFGQTPLHIACLNKSNSASQIVKPLLDNGGNVNCVDEDNPTPVHLTDVKDENNLTSLQVSYCVGWIDGIKYLIDNDRNTALQDNDDNTVMHSAFYEENYKNPEIILGLTSSHSINLNLSNNLGLKALLLSIEVGNHTVFDHLLEVGGEELAMQEDVEGKSALHYICLKDNYQLCKKFLEHAKKMFRSGGKYLIEKQCKGGLTPLSLAVSGGYYDLVELLVETGRASVDIIDDDGNTLVHLAAMKIDSSMKEPNPELSPNIFKIHSELKEKHEETLNKYPAMSLMSYLTSKGCHWKETSNHKVESIIRNQAVQEVLVYYNEIHGGGASQSDHEASGSGYPPPTITPTINVYHVSPVQYLSHDSCFFCEKPALIQTIKCGHRSNLVCYDCFQNRHFRCLECHTWHNGFPTHPPTSQNLNQNISQPNRQLNQLQQSDQTQLSAPNPWTSSSYCETQRSQFIFNSGFKNHQLCLLCNCASLSMKIKCQHETNFLCYNCFQEFIFKCARHNCSAWHNRPTNLSTSDVLNQNHIFRCRDCFPLHKLPTQSPASLNPNQNTLLQESGHLNQQQQLWSTSSASFYQAPQQHPANNQSSVISQDNLTQQGASASYIEPGTSSSGQNNHSSTNQQLFLPLYSSENSGLNHQTQQNLVAHQNQETNQLGLSEQLQASRPIQHGATANYTGSSCISDMQTGNNLSANSGSSVNAGLQNIASNYINPDEIEEIRNENGDTIILVYNGNRYSKQRTAKRNPYTTWQCTKNAYRKKGKCSATIIEKILVQANLRYQAGRAEHLHRPENSSQPQGTDFNGSHES